MKAPTQILPPQNWQDFEELCKRIWQNKWENPEDIVRNGRLGQAQNGVDISAYVESKGGYCGVQCKGKDNYTHSKLTTDEIDREIEKAKKFQPELKSFTFATTAPKDAVIEEYVRLKNVENRKNDLFSISLFSWEDIVSLIEQFGNVKDWYLFEKLQVYEPELKLLVKDNESPDLIELHPQYTSQKIIYLYENPAYSISSVSFADGLTFFKEMMANTVEFEIDLVNEGICLENCTFEIIMEESSNHKFFTNDNVLHEIAGQFELSEFEMITKKEFTFQSGRIKRYKILIECSESPISEEFKIECIFTSKQNRKPFTKTLVCKVEPEIIYLEDGHQKTSNRYEDHTSKRIIKPKSLKDNA